MNKILLTLLAGLLAGGVITIAAIKVSDSRNESSVRLVRDIVNIPPLEYAQALEHRANHFNDLRTIESIQALPNDFVRSEALYTLSGRSNSVELKTLALDAIRIADPVARKRALEIIFFRLTEIDSNSALELMQTPEFSRMRGVEYRVWQTLARSDLMAAIAAARSLEERRKRSVVQIMYRAVGGAYTDDAKIIEDELGIRPNTANRAASVRRLFDNSPATALAHILSLNSAVERAAQVRTLASLLARVDLQAAEEFADNIDDASLRQHFLETVFDTLADNNPILALEKKFAINAAAKIGNSDKKQLTELAKSDLDRALRLFDLTTDQETRTTLASIIVAEYARQRPVQALEWAREKGDSGSGRLMKTLYGKLAVANTELALNSAQAIENEGKRRQMTLIIINAVAEQSPLQATTFLAQIKSKRTRDRAVQRIADSWMKKDARAAVDWLLSSNPEASESVFRNKRGANDIDLDEAQLIVMSLPSKYRKSWARGIAERLAGERSAEDALLFVQQFEGQADYDMQMAHLVSTIADKDPLLAASWAKGIQDSTARDAALANVVSTSARRKPAETAFLLHEISDPDLRQVSSSELVKRWYRVDADGASRWLDALPHGPERDNIIMNTSMNMSSDRNRQTLLIDSIDDPGIRQQAIFMQSVFTSRGDPKKQIKLLDEMDMPDIFRQQIKAQILRSAASGN